MYIIKNALKSISRSKGRSLLIGIIVLVISTSTCIGLSIRNAAENARETALEGLTITAQISVDRSAMMEDIKTNMNTSADSEQSGKPSFDKDSFMTSMKGMESITVEEMKTYAELDSVKSFYYTTSVSMNGSEVQYEDGSENAEFEPVSTNGSSSKDSDESEDSSESEDSDETADSSESGDGKDSQMSEFGDKSGQMGMGGQMEMQGGKMGFERGSMGTQGDFTLIGYSSDEAMTDFLNGTCTITEGIVFEEGTAEYQCIISDELATYNNIACGDVISVCNPNDEEEIYELEVIGIYNNSQSTVTSSNMMQGFSTSSDAANQIYLSYEALNSIVTTSSENAEESTDETTGITTTTALPSQESGTYVFATVEDYNQFAEDVYDAGLSEDYTVTSSDVSEYENSLLPLENLSQMSLYFLLVVLGIGGVVLIVLNIFNVRERKYEVGVLTAIGMKKLKVSLQFILETLLVTIVFVLIGGCIGAATSVPITNKLLESQVEAQENESNTNTESFGRESSFNKGGMQGGGDMPGGMSDMSGRGSDSKRGDSAVGNYISEVSSATDIVVLLKLLGIGVLLALVASAASVIFIMRYDPLKILANRD